MNTPEHISESLATNFLGLKIFKFCVADPGSDAILMLDPDVGWKNRIQDRCHKSSYWFSQVHSFIYADMYNIIRVAQEIAHERSLRQKHSYMSSTLLS